MIETLRQLAVFSDPVAFWITGALVTAIAAYALRTGLAGFWRLRLVTDTPTAKIRSTPQGYVALSGKALPYQRTLAARLTGSPCIWYRFKVEERRRSGKNNHWITIESGEANKLFLLDDGTGHCLVEPAPAELHCRAKDIWYGRTRRAPRPSIHRWLTTGGRFRLTEERITAQEPIYLLGRFETPRRGPQERERLTKSLLTSWKRDPERMAGFDRDKDGEISLGEWEQARAKAQHLAEQSESRLQAEPSLSRVTATQDARRPFVIATLDGDSLLRRLRLRAFGGTTLFLLLISGLGFSIAARLLHG